MELNWDFDTKEISFTSSVYELEVINGIILAIEENEDFTDIINEHGIKYEVLEESNWDGVPEMKFNGTKKQLIPLLTLFDPNCRNVNELTKVLENWNGDNDELWETLEY